MNIFLGCHMELGQGQCCQTSVKGLYQTQVMLGDHIKILLLILFHLDLDGFVKFLDILLKFGVTSFLLQEWLDVFPCDHHPIIINQTIVIFLGITIGKPHPSPNISIVLVCKGLILNNRLKIILN